MRRRDFIVFVGSALLSTAAEAQPASAGRKVGVLFPGVFGEDRERRLADGLASELGAEKVTLLVRSAEGDSQLLSKYADELVVARVDLIVAIASGGLEAARRVTQAIPIVALDLESDPIATGAAQSLNRPGGNVTGVFFDAPEIAGKWIQIMRELVPHISRAGLLYDMHLDQTQLKAGEISAHKVGIETLRLGIGQPSDFRKAFENAVEAKVDAVLVHSSPIFVDKAAVIAELAREFRLPSIGLFPVYAKMGGPYFVWTEQLRTGETSGRHCRKNSARGATSRFPDPAADLSAVPDKSQHGKISKADHSTIPVRPGRRSDRIAVGKRHASVMPRGFLCAASTAPAGLTG